MKALSTTVPSSGTLHAGLLAKDEGHGTCSAFRNASRLTDALEHSSLSREGLRKGQKGHLCPELWGFTTAPRFTKGYGQCRVQHGFVSSCSKCPTSGTAASPSGSHPQPAPLVLAALQSWQQGQSRARPEGTHSANVQGKCRCHLQPVPGELTLVTRQELWLYPCSVAWPLGHNIQEGNGPGSLNTAKGSSHF